MAYSSSINTGLPNIADPPDPTFFAEFTRVYNAVRNLTLAVDSYTGRAPPDQANFVNISPVTSILVGNMTKMYAKFVTSLAVRTPVVITNYFAGIPSAEAASSNDPGTHMHGFVSIDGGAGGWGEITLIGVLSGFAGLTPGQPIYLGNTAGTYALTPGTWPQRVGFAVSTTAAFISPEKYLDGWVPPALRPWASCTLSGSTGLLTNYNPTLAGTLAGGITINGANTTLTVPRTGLYTISARQLVDSTACGVTYFGIRINGLDTDYAWHNLIMKDMMVTKLLQLIAGDTIAVFITASNNTWSGAHSNLSVKFEQ